VFTSIYGNGIYLAADGFGGANLSNSGETISLLDAGGGVILSFSYGDASPWPAAADGQGPSLELIDPLGSPGNPANWRASAAPGGSPGRDGLAPPQQAGDYDGSGHVDQQDYAAWRSQFGMSVASPGAGADGNADGIVDIADYVVWRNNLGMTSASRAAGASAPPAAHAPALTRRMVPPTRSQFTSAISEFARDQALLELLLDSRGQRRDLVARRDLPFSTSFVVPALAGADHLEAVLQTAAEDPVEPAPFAEFRASRHLARS
jgi:hypothetical protein